VQAPPERAIHQGLLAGDGGIHHMLYRMNPELQAVQPVGGALDEAQLGIPHAPLMRVNPDGQFTTVPAQ